MYNAWRSPKSKTATLNSNEIEVNYTLPGRILSGEISNEGTQYGKTLVHISAFSMDRKIWMKWTGRCVQVTARLRSKIRSFKSSVHFMFNRIL